MYRRISVTLPEETARLLDCICGTGGRGKLINKAVRLYIKRIGRTNLRRRLRQGYVRTAARDLRLSAEWFLLREK